MRLRAALDQLTLQIEAPADAPAAVNENGEDVRLAG